MQVDVFERADLVVGPHGAALANCIFSRPGTPLIEFHSLNPRVGPNSPLYVLLSRLLQASAAVGLEGGQCVLNLTPA